MNAVATASFYLRARAAAAAAVASANEEVTAVTCITLRLSIPR